MTETRWQLQWVGEDSLMVRADPDEDLAQLNSLQAHCQSLFGVDLLDSILAYDSLLLIFEVGFALTHYDTIQTRLQSPMARRPNHQTQLHQLPICYDPEFALDLASIAAYTGLCEQHIINTHQNTEYHVRAMGFSPGFGYFGDLPAELSIPRKVQPRAQVPAGSVAIAGRQTVIYPQASPGGWHILGRSPVTLFDPSKPLSQANLLRTGDRIRFYGISRPEFERWNQPS